MRAKINTKGFKNKMDKLEKVPNKTIEESYTELKKNTPVRSGNARNRTKLNKSNHTINSNYDYAGRLNSGWSKQAPKGFTEPTVKFMQRYISDLIGKI